MSEHNEAREAVSFFTTKERGDETIFVLRDDRPEWVYDLVYAAHGDFGPDTWRYAAIYSALSHLADDAGSTDDLDDLGDEWADSYVDIYTGARTEWLASNLNRVGYCDEAREELGGDMDIASMIGLGQYMEAREVWSSVVDSLRALAEVRSAESV